MTPQQLYEATDLVAPTWAQLGDVTRSVWGEKCARLLAGDGRWWSCFSNGEGTIYQTASTPRSRGANTGKTMNHKLIADQLDNAADALHAVADCFREQSGDGADSAADAAPAKPVSKPKPAATVKPAAKKAAAEEPEVTIDDMREKLKELIAAKGKEKMVEALATVGAGKLADVDESQYSELMATVDTMIADEGEAEVPVPAKKTKTPAVTLEQVSDAAKALIAADKPAYLALAKKLGKPSEMDAKGYAAALTAFQDAMPADDEDMI